MEKTLLTILILILLFCFVSCSTKGSKIEDQTSKENITEENLSKEQQKKEYEYADYFDENLIWYPSGPVDFPYPTPEKGEVELNMNLEKLLDNTTPGEKKYVVYLFEEAGAEPEKVYNMLKNAGIETELDGMSDEERYRLYDENVFGCLIYATKEQILTMKCPEDMAIGLLECQRPDNLEVTEESIEYYKNDELPVKRGNFKGYITKEEAREALNNGDIIYWDWELMEIQWQVEKFK